MTDTAEPVAVSVPASVARRSERARGASREPSSTLDVVSTLGLGTLALLPVGAYLWVALHRIGYPFELEWLEGGAVSVVQRVATGHGLYVQPSLHYVAWPYPPLYFWVSAGMAQITGVGFLALRLVSFLASLGSFGLLYTLVARPFRDRVAGLCAVGLYAASYRLTGAWLDIGRVDSLFIFLFLLAVLAAQRATSWRGGIAVGTLLFLAFFTKQTALVAALPLLAWMLVRRSRVGASALGTLTLLVVGSTLVMNALSGGWYGYYVFGELAHQPIASAALTRFWTVHLLGPLGVALLLGGAGLLCRWAARRRNWTYGRPATPALVLGPLGFDLAVVLGLVLAAWVGRLHTGGGDDVLIPAAAGVALLVGQGCAALRGCTSAAWRWLTTVVLAGALALQISQLRYPLATQIPTAADRQAGYHLLATLRQQRGQVIVLDHPWYATLAGKGSWAQEEAIDEVLRSTDNLGKRALLEDLPGALESPDISAVVLDDPDDARGLAGTLAHDFVQVPGSVLPGNAFYPVTDLRLRPSLLFVRRAAGPYPQPEEPR